MHVVRNGEDRRWEVLRLGVLGFGVVWGIRHWGCRVYKYDCHQGGKICVDYYWGYYMVVN